jgi:putative ABC transport system permease protein
VRGRGDSGSWARELPRALARVDARLGPEETDFMDDLLSRSQAQGRVGASVLASFSAFGLLLAALGIFSMVSFTTRERRVEIGIRVAVGATPREVRRLVLRHGLWRALAGVALGLPLALAAGRILAGTIDGFSARPLLCAAVAGGLFIIAALTCDVPARQAARADALTALRSA